MKLCVVCNGTGYHRGYAWIGGKEISRPYRCGCKHGMVSQGVSEKFSFIKETKKDFIKSPKKHAFL
jgi:hypothetical protein